MHGPGPSSALHRWQQPPGTILPHENLQARSGLTRPLIRTAQSRLSLALHSLVRGLIPFPFSLERRYGYTRFAQGIQRTFLCPHS